MAKNYLKNGDYVNVVNADFVVDDNGRDLIELSINKRDIEYYDSETREYHRVYWDNSVSPPRMYWED